MSDCCFTCIKQVTLFYHKLFSSGRFHPKGWLNGWTESITRLFSKYLKKERYLTNNLYTSSKYFIFCLNINNIQIFIIFDIILQCVYYKSRNRIMP